MNIPSDSSPPAKEKPALDERNERLHTATSDSNPQESATLALYKSWLRSGPKARWQFLLDLKAAHPALLRAVMESEVHE